jgi:hypothetical protein
VSSAKSTCVLNASNSITGRNSQIYFNRFIEKINKLNMYIQILLMTMEYNMEFCAKKAKNYISV